MYVIGEPLGGAGNCSAASSRRVLPFVR